MWRFAAGLIGAVVIVASACQSSQEEHRQKNMGKQIFSAYCVSCHGPNGTREINGAAKLVTSQYGEEEIKERIRNGKDEMPPFGAMLGREELDAVSGYVLKLREKSPNGTDD